MDDFKLILRTVIFRLGEINNIMIFSFVKKKFLNFFLVRQNSDVVYFTETEKHRSENELKIIRYVQIWPPDV